MEMGAGMTGEPPKKVSRILVEAMCSEMVDLEVQLDAYVNEQVPALASWLNSYRRQYFGFLRDGKQLIMVVGFCKPVSIDWRREMVTLPESGGCYFESQYDAANDDFLYLWEGVER